MRGNDKADPLLLHVAPNSASLKTEKREEREEKKKKDPLLTNYTEPGGYKVLPAHKQEDGLKMSV